MAYNLRTGLIGSGDIDVNVSLTGLTADNIQSGTFGSDRIPTLGNSKISALDAAKLTGTLSADRIAAGSIGDTKLTLSDSSIAKAKVQSGANTGKWDLEDIPSLPTSQITSGTFELSFIPSIPTGQLLGQIASTQLSLVASDIPSLGAEKITTGTFASQDRIPNLSADKITTGTFAKSKISTAETWALDDIPLLPATKIGSGIFDAAKIPDLSALKITSDTLSADRIPGLNASKITAGVISADRLPSAATASECLMLRAVGARYAGSPASKSIGTSFGSLDSNLSGSFTAPASEIVTVSLKFYLSSGSGSEHWVAAQLVKGGTTTEFVEAYSLDDDGCKGTKFTYVLERGNYDKDDQQVEVTWVLDQLTAGSSYAIDVQVKASENKTCFFGASNGNLVNYPPIVFRVDAAPSNSNVHIYSPGGI